MATGKCYECGRFISAYTELMNHKFIQHPGVFDPEPYEVSYCDSCEAKRTPRRTGGQERGEVRDAE